MKTATNDFYMLLGDQTGYCRSCQKGPQKMAAALYFTPEPDEAMLAQTIGGTIVATTEPEPGCYPLYVHGEHWRFANSLLSLDANSFSLGSAVTTLHAPRQPATR